MKYRLICDFCENFDSKTEIGHINDHQPQKTFEEINSAIKRLGYDCEIYGGVPELLCAYNKKIDSETDIIYINLSDGTDKRYSRVQIPILCDLMNLKYSGGGTFETALTTNKFYCSLAVKEHGFNTPQGTLITNISNLNEIKDYKSIVKPNAEGSSIGITSKSVCSNKKETIEQATVMLNQYHEILVEEYISGYDVTCFVIGNENILLNEILLIEHHNKIFFDSEVMEYKDHMFNTRHFLPVGDILSKKAQQKIKEITVEIKNLLNIYDFCRVDYRITKDEQIYFLEINTVPAICMDSQVGVICKNLNISFDDFINYIIETVTLRLS